MKLISIGTDRKLFEEDSSVRQRVIEYGKFFEEIHIIVFSTRKYQIPNTKYQTPKQSKLATGQANSKIQISKNVFVYPTNSRNKFFYVFDALRIFKTIIHDSYPIIHNFVITCQDPFETGIVGAIAKLFFNLPLHIQIHTDFAGKYFKESVLNKIRFLLAEFVIKYSDGVRVVSERIKRSIELFSKNIDVLPISQGLTLGNEDSKVRPLEKDLNIERLKDWRKTKNILTVCRLEKEKNLETALRAFKKVLEYGIEATFTIVGDGSERKKLEKLCQELKIEDRVIFFGWQNNLEKYYNNADIYISTSLYEGYGVSVVEAGSFSLPLVLSDTGVAGEIFENGKNAFVCDAKDENCFAQNIIKLCQDQNLMKEFGDRAKIAVKNHLDRQNYYYEKYADSIKKTVSDFKKKSLATRIFDFKIALWHSLIYLRYFVCGITAAATNIVSLYIFTDIVGIWYLYSSVLAFFLSLVISFTLQKFVVFKDNGTKEIQNQFSRFFIVAILGVITNTILMFVCVDILNIWYIFAQIIAGFFVMIQNFLLYKFFIFHKK